MTGHRAGISPDVATILTEVAGLDGDAMRGTDNAATAANLAVAQTRLDDSIGSGISGRTITATLHVSPDGDNSDGSSWAKAYQTIQAALTAASTDANDCTLILIAPHATYYDIDTTGDPTWTGNYELRGTHRIWAAIRNEHDTATSVFKFTGKVSLVDLAIFTEDAVNGVIFTNNGWRVRTCGFNSSGTDGANTSVYIDGSAALTRGGIMGDVQFIGNAATTTAISINQSTVNEFHNVNIHTCLVGVLIADADSDYNKFNNIDIGDSALGLDINAGNEQHFDNIHFHHNTANVDDEVKDHNWINIIGQFPIAILPDNFTGVACDTGDGADAWTLVLQTLYTNAGHGPFRIVGIHLEPAVAGWYRLHMTADETIYFDDLMFDANKREGTAAPSGTEYIFNAGTVIKGASKSDSDGVDGLIVWLEVQLI